MNGRDKKPIFSGIQQFSGIDSETHQEIQTTVNTGNYKIINVDNLPKAPFQIKDFLWMKLQWELPPDSKDSDTSGFCSDYEKLEADGKRQRSEAGMERFDKVEVDKELHRRASVRSGWSGPTASASVPVK